MPFQIPSVSRVKKSPLVIVLALFYFAIRSLFRFLSVSPAHIHLEPSTARVYCIRLYRPHPPYRCRLPRPIYPALRNIPYPIPAIPICLILLPRPARFPVNKFNIQIA